MSTYTCLRYHLIFGTKERMPLITPSIEKDLHSYMSGIFSKLRGVVLEINGTEDHVHILAGLPPTVAVADALQQVKGGSSWWVNNQRCPDQPFKWQAGYGAFTVSESQVPKVRRYISTQKEHHQHRSFNDELKALLKKHGLDRELANLLSSEATTGK